MRTWKRVVWFLLLATAIHGTHWNSLSILKKREKAPSVLRIGEADPEYTAVAPPGFILKHFTFGYDHIISDLMWLQVIQHVGGYLLGYSPVVNTFPLLEAIVTLDPLFRGPILFSSFTLSFDLKKPNQAIQLLWKGLQAEPRYWEYYFYIGFVYYFYMDNEEEAAQYFYAASKMPNAPESPKRMGALLLEKRGEFETSYRMWYEVYQTTKDPLTKKRAEKKLKELEQTLKRGAK